MLKPATLQSLTARLARLTSSAAVSAFVLDEAVGEVGATSGSLCLVVDGELELASSIGYSQEVLDAYRRFPIDLATPAGECAVTHRAVYCGSLEELFVRYPIFQGRPVVGDPSVAVLPLVSSSSKTLGTLVIGFSTARRFIASDRSFLEALAIEAGAALERARANEALIEARASAEQARDQLAFLAEASERLADSLDLDETLQAVANLAVPRIADRCALYLLAEQRRIDKLALAPALNADETALFEQYPPRLDDPSGVGSVITSGRPVHVPVVTDEILQAGARSEEHLELMRRAGIGGTYMTALSARGHRFGALAFVNRSERAFDEADRALAEELARRAAVAIDNARMFSEERSIAETLQRALLPELSAMPALDVAVRYFPGTEGLEVGGDWYDVVCTEPDRFVFVVGDVSGRGLRAATTMALLRYAGKAYIALGDPPGVVLTRLGQLLSFEASEQFASVLIGELALDTGRLTLASAGHLPPLLVADEGADFIPMAVTTPVGVAGIKPEETTIALAPPAMLVAFTDGLVERRGEHLDAGLGRLRSEAVLGESAAACVDHLARQLIAGGAEDDAVILGLRWRS